MTNLWPDLRFSLRAIKRSPLFASVAILSLALGIGANTAIFTLMDQLMLRALPIKNPDQLVMLYQRGAHNGSNMGDRMHSYPIYQDYQKKAEPLSEVLARRMQSNLRDAYRPTIPRPTTRQACPWERNRRFQKDKRAVRA